jgi:hypothetical protein
MFWIEWELCSLDCFVELIPFFYVRVPSRQEVNGGKRKEAESQQGQKTSETHLLSKNGFARNYF